ncbi:MAG: hypothetical protein AcusKO_22380 [Acuticoccus sp.]
MSFRLKCKDESVADGLRRVVRAHIEAAIADIDDASLPRENAVHEVRKRCKKIRSLVRLAGPHFKRAARENARFRDAAAALSASRDADVLVATFDALGTHFGERFDAAAFAPAQAMLLARKNSAAQTPLDDQLATFRDTMEAALPVVETWRIKGGNTKVLGDGTCRSLTRARGALKAAKKKVTEERMHTLRKRVKDVYYQYGFLRDLWPAPLKATVNELSVLAELLGDEHDLSVFESAMDALAEDGLDATVAEALKKLAHERKAALGAAALSLAERAFAAMPQAEADRFVALWTAWRNAPAPLDKTPTPEDEGNGEPTEIERKFLVTGEDWREAVARTRSIRQGYLCHNDKVSLRVRVVDGKSARLGLKSAAPTLERTEVECKIPVADAEALLALAEGHVAEKQRHVVPLGERTVEIDEYQGRDSGLILAEVEMKTADETPPDAAWLGKEVTGDTRYYAATIARAEAEKKKPAPKRQARKRPAPARAK